MNENLEFVKEMGSDLKGFFTKQGLQNFVWVMTNNDKWQRNDPLLKRHFCTTCSHHEKYHRKSYSNDDEVEFCKKCFDEGLKFAGHNFNKKQPELMKAIGQVIKGHQMIHSDKYRMYVYTTYLSKEELDNLESFFNLKISSIGHISKDSHRIILWTTKIFCRYCNSPFVEKCDRVHHEINCYRKPDEVTFVDSLDEND